MIDIRNKSWPKALGFGIAFVLALVALAAYYNHFQNSVRVETVELNSSLLGKRVPYNVLLPPGYGSITKRGIRYPVLYLLHGWRAHFDSWVKETALAGYGAEHRLIIVMPEGDNGWYTDSATVNQDQNETYFTRESIPM